MSKKFLRENWDGDEKILAGLALHSLSNGQKVARVEAVREMLRILPESETNDFNSIATSDKSWFQHITVSSHMFARSAAELISRTRQAAGVKITMITVFFTAKTCIMFDVLSKGTTFNQLYFINNILPDLKTANLNFRRQKTRSTFRGDMEPSMCHNRTKVTSKIKKNHISRMIYLLYSQDISFPQVTKLRTRLHKYGITSLLTTSRACSGTGSCILPGSLRIMENLFANKTRFASSYRLDVEIGTFWTPYRCMRFIAGIAELPWIHFLRKRENSLLIIIFIEFLEE
jgi:hypothetical protein